MLHTYTTLNMNRLLIAFQLIILPLAVRGWEVAVVTTNQVDFLSSNGSMLGNIPKPLSDLQAMEFDPVHERLFLSDDTNSDYSVFSLSLQAKQVLTPVIKRAENHKVRDIAYDTVLETLYWTGEKAIHWYRNTMKNKEGEILHKLGDTEFPHGITIDSCRRYLYWTNSYHLEPTIERSLLDGTERKIIIRNELFQPMGIAVDELGGKIYWSDDQAGIYFSIKRANLDGSNYETIIRGTHHEPFFLAIGVHDVYWSDLVYNAVWKISKEPTENEEPTPIYQYSDGRIPQGIVTRSNGRTSACQATETTASAEIQNSNYGIMSDGPMGSMVSESSVKEIHISSDYCLNAGVLIMERKNGTICQCPKGYDGERCEMSSCHNFCLNDGKCEIDLNGAPTCICRNGTNGSRCEQNLCGSYCLNDAKCEVDSRGQPICKCKSHFSGSRCEVSALEHTCRPYCQKLGQVYVPIDGGVTPMCMCPSTMDSGQYELLPLENASSSSNGAVSSAELNQSCVHDKTISDWVSAALGCACAILMVATAILLRKVFVLRKRPRIKKRIIVNKNVTPLTSRPPLPPEQCEITIENCCNMNICETPCFEPQLRTPKSSQREEKKTLLGSMEEAPTSSPCQEDLY